MILKYDLEIDNEVIKKDIERLTNQVYKLLPSREEGNDWKTPLENLIVEICGMAHLVGDQLDFFSLLCRMEGLLNLTEEDQFFLFRKNIFECLNLMNRIKKCLDSN